MIVNSVGIVVCVIDAGEDVSKRRWFCYRRQTERQFGSVGGLRRRGSVFPTGIESERRVQVIGKSKKDEGKKGNLHEARDDTPATVKIHHCHWPLRSGEFKFALHQLFSKGKLGRDTSRLLSIHLASAYCCTAPAIPLPILRALPSRRPWLAPPLPRPCSFRLRAA